jgi:hypothetical protein
MYPGENSINSVIYAKFFGEKIKELIQQKEMITAAALNHRY